MQVHHSPIISRLITEEDERVVSYHYTISSIYVGIILEDTVNFPTLKTEISPMLQLSSPATHTQNAPELLLDREPTLNNHHQLYYYCRRTGETKEQTQLARDRHNMQPQKQSIATDWMLHPT